MSKTEFKKSVFGCENFYGKEKEGLEDFMEKKNCFKKLMTNFPNLLTL